jgi:hypothetical protein
MTTKVRSSYWTASWIQGFQFLGDVGGHFVGGEVDDLAEQVLRRSSPNSSSWGEGKKHVAGEQIDGSLLVVRLQKQSKDPAAGGELLNIRTAEGAEYGGQ